MATSGEKKMAATGENRWPPVGRTRCPLTPEGQELEVMTVELEHGGLYVIHAMPLRKKYKTRYEEGQ